MLLWVIWVICVFLLLNKKNTHLFPGVISGTAKDILLFSGFFVVLCSSYKALRIESHKLCAVWQMNIWCPLMDLFLSSWSIGELSGRHLFWKTSPMNFVVCLVARQLLLFQPWRFPRRQLVEILALHGRTQ